MDRYEARTTAQNLLHGNRLQHSLAVGDTAALLVDTTALPECVAAAAYVHDVGYNEGIAITGLHPLDGAIYLTKMGADSEIVSLVAYHSASEQEARNRGLLAELSWFTRPHPAHLDAVTWADMTTGPTGEAVTVLERLEEILDRYPANSVVARTVRQQRPYLLGCVRRTAARQTREMNRRIYA